jgi:hypothetical protein
MNWNSIFTATLPVLLAAIGFLISSINEMENRLYVVEGRMMQLVTPDGQIIPSPSNALARQAIKEEVTLKVLELGTRVTLLEEKSKQQPQ